MTRYGHAIIKIGGERGADLQRDFALELRKHGIIWITDAQIERYYQLDMEAFGGSEQHVVLHGWRQTRAFRKMMEQPQWDYDPDVAWEITKGPESKIFQEWLEKKGNERKLTPKEPKRGTKTRIKHGL